MKKIQDFFWGILGIVIFITFIIATYLLLAFGVKIVPRITPILISAATISLYLCILVLLPLAIFRKTRIISIYGLLIASYVFGASLWVYAFFATYVYWGLFGIIVGLIIAGVGIVPVGLLATIFHADWLAVGNITLGIVLTFGARILAFYWGERMDQQQIEEEQVVSSQLTHMIACSNCGKNNVYGSNFCKFCGSEL